jgi:KUP system potassium uptake protein
VATAAYAVPTPRTRSELAALSLGALGVVYGDIGTSPLYAMRACLGLGEERPYAVTPQDVFNVYGVISLFFWALVLVVCLKYLTFVLRADNKGEGGILALAALVAHGPRARTLALPILLALFGAGLLYGDGAITPAISVLGAVEGLSTQNPALTSLVVPITVAILIGLFAVQRHGTHRIGSISGWVMLVWFATLGALGLRWIAIHPSVLLAMSPHYAVMFLLHHGLNGFLLLGLVFLCVTGGEALYADMGHFGKRPIRVAWFAIAFPGLLLNYFGQGALYLERGLAVENPFYDLAPPLLVIPLMLLATMAAIIASQALISGAFSLTNQAVQLGYLPRATVVHTSSKIEGQIYIPEANWLLMLACVALVIAFGSSSELAAAYGVAVTGTMTITSFLYFLVCRRNWHYSIGAALALVLPFLVIDTAFFSANTVKVFHGGWFPLAIGILLFVVMTTWWRGRDELSVIMESGTAPEALFLADVKTSHLPRVSGTAVFMSAKTEGIPNVLLHHVKHNKVLHRQVVLLSVITRNVPFVVGNKSLEVRELGNGFFRVIASVGFMQQPNVPKILTRCERHAIRFVPADTTYYLGRQTLLTSGKTHMARSRKLLFAFLSRNARTPAAFFHLPPNRVVELGLQIEL